MKKHLFFFAIILCSTATFAQNSVGIGTRNPNPKAVLDLRAAGMQGLLAPRLSSIDTSGFSAGISEKGMLFYDTTSAVFRYFDGDHWKVIGSGGSVTETDPKVGTLSNEYLPKWDNATSKLVTSSILENTAGNIGVGGIADASYRLRVYGKVRTIGVNETSDRRMKKDIQPIAGALEKIGKLQGVRYNWRNSEFPTLGLPNKTDLGLIAQDVEKVLPELVDTDNSGYKSVQYSHLVAVLVEAIKEQQKQIEKLQSDKVALEKRTESLEKQTASLDDLQKRMKFLEQTIQDLSSKAAK
jgi:chaperonin cofactor prefoldin